MSRQLHEAARQDAADQRELLGAIPAAKLLTATVKTVTPGAATDGRATVTVDWYGGEYLVASYPTNYTPAAADVVICGLFDLQLRILSPQGGFP